MSRRRLTPGAKVDLAMIYARDGAFHTAAKLLHEAAEAFEKHARAADAFIDEMIARGEVEADRSADRGRQS